eukprot:c21901_g3_i2.p1 GENE.c21901_g3_i2~~c21901_g3_i2.p1  ORF type:complete len:515 (+),score=266.05 c21901_g3_i2:28-1545(+)
MSCGKNCPSHHVQGADKNHQHQPHTPRPKVLETVLEAVGNTPLVRIDRFSQKHGIKCQLFAKCEFFSAGGSTKDRIGLRMIEEAEKAGKIKPGDTLIEPTSGNTGIGLALAGAVKGYKVIITLPMKMSNEKVNVLKALGAEIIRTPTEAAWDSPESHMSVAKRLNEQIKNSHILDQYGNLYNPLAHYDGTAEEILDSLDGNVDVVVISAGTGGTLTGISRKIKERCPNCKIVGVDPHGSILALPESLNGQISSYFVEGIGYDFIPNVCDRNAADVWIKSNDKDSFMLSRELIRTEGLLCGGSSGAVLYAAIQIAKELDESKRVVVILPDSVRNYMSKFLSPDWLIDRGFADEALINEVTQNDQWWSKLTVSSLQLSAPHTLLPSVTCGDAIKIMSNTGFGQLPVVDESGSVLGMITEGNLVAKLRSGGLVKTDPVSKALYKDFHKVDPSRTLAELSRYFDRDSFVLVVLTTRRSKSSNESDIIETVIGIATRIDLLNFITDKAPL